MQGKVEISGVNTAKLRTLSNDEMMALIDRAQSGDEEARRKLVEGNLKLVLSVIQRFMGRGENPDDLFQVGCIGLLKAIANFDTSKQVRFSTYGDTCATTAPSALAARCATRRIGSCSASRSFLKRTGASPRWRRSQRRWTCRWRRL